MFQIVKCPRLISQSLKNSQKIKFWEIDYFPKQDFQNLPVFRILSGYTDGTRYRVHCFYPNKYYLKDKPEYRAIVTIRSFYKQRLKKDWLIDYSRENRDFSIFEGLYLIEPEESSTYVINSLRDKDYLQEFLEKEKSQKIKSIQRIYRPTFEKLTQQGIEVINHIW